LWYRYLLLSLEERENIRIAKGGINMALLNERVRSQVKDLFKGLKEEVKLVVFTQEIECLFCEDTRRLAEEVASLSDKVSAEVFNFVLDKDKVERYNIDKIPAIVVEGKKSNLLPGTKARLKALSNPVHIQVFVTLTCPYCPGAVQTAHKMAMESDLIRADMVEASEFPHLTNKYNVLAVPKVVINETIEFEGALPESQFLEYVLKAGSVK
jgi:alkyl hydroperoxide reductase subunit AhpF